MRIESSSINIQADTSSTTAKSFHESLNIWTNQSSISIGTTVDVQEFSSNALQISNSMVKSTTEMKCSEDEEGLNSEHKLKIKLIEAFIYNVSGKKISIKVPKLKLLQDGYDSNGNTKSSPRLVLSNGNQSNGPGFGLIYNRNETQLEKTRISFEAQGIIKTSDGREVMLDLNFNVDQEVVQHSSFQLRMGEALKDPLVINFEGGLASFTSRNMSFDLDLDGTIDSIKMLSGNCGYLALDKNRNGIIDDGRELFGPQTDHGYEELASYDEDGNGWIDEGDTIFNHLKIWYHDKEGISHLVALTEKNVGAIYLGHIETEMNLYAQNEIAGKLRNSGLVLLENGESRIMQELDIKI